MPHYVPLSRSDHRHSSFVPQGYGFAARQPAVPVVMDELAQLLPSMPLALVKSEDRSRFQLVALQALEANNNVYVHTNGRWITGYRPAWYRAHPFRLLQQAGDETAERQRVLCVDTTAPGIEDHADDDAAIAFFDAAGEISPSYAVLWRLLNSLNARWTPPLRWSPSSKSSGWWCPGISTSASRTP